MNATEIKYETSAEESRSIDRIVNRVIGIADRQGVNLPDPPHLEMDIVLCHLNACDLRLMDLLNAKDSDFMHDINGIRENLNRQTCQLENGFLPRYAA